MNTKGYLIIAQNSGKTDYIKMAYALALSIKNTQTYNNVAIAVMDPNEIPKKYKKVFDHVITIPWTDAAKKSKWKIENKWKFPHLSPFDETVLLDADMVFPESIDNWWYFMNDYEMLATTRTCNYRGNTIHDDFYRTTFRHAGLPNVHTAFFYFKKTPMVFEFSKMCEMIFNNWERYYWEFIPKYRPNYLVGDLCFALAMDLMNISHKCTTTLPFPTFVHMKAKIQDVPQDLVTEDWTKHFNAELLSDGIIEVNNHIQFSPFHYIEKKWLTDEKVTILEKIYEQSR